MSKRALKRLETCICLMICVLFLGQISAFAEEIKPVHEYNFDNDSDQAINDSGIGGSPIKGNNHVSKTSFVAGYNGVGKAIHFDGNDYINIPSKALPVGERSIRFQFKKDASTVTDKTEPIIMTFDPRNIDGYKLYMGIGNNQSNIGEGVENTIPGHLWIIEKDSSVNFKLQSPDSICDGEWHDILYTWDGTTRTNSVKLYVDDMATPVAQTTAVTTDKRDNNDNWYVFVGICPTSFNGMYNGNYVNDYLKEADLDNLQFYNLVIPPETNTSSNLKAVGGNSKVDLNWNEVTGATSYTVKRSTTAGGPYTTIATGVTGTTYTDTDVTNGTTYYYVVTAIVNGSEGWNSNEASATPQASTDQPTGNKALLVITMVTGERKEYEMTTDKINDFITWYNSKAALSPTYAIEKDYNKASFTARKDYIAYDQISNFEVNEYND